MAQRSDDDLMRRLLATFAGEADERLQSLTRDLLLLERATDATEIETLLQNMFRDAHSLKGAARAVNLDRVERLAHKLESTLERLQRGDLQPDTQVCDAIYRVTDAMTALVAEASTGTVSEVDLDGLEARLDDPHAAAAESAPPVAEPQAAPTAGAAITDETVRMAVSKLDALMAGVGELLVALIGADQRISDLQRLSEELNAWEAGWRKMQRHHRAALADVPAAQELLDLIGEHEGRLRESRSALDELCRLFAADGRRMSQVTSDLSDDVHRARMLPVSSVLDAFGRMVRDIARDQGKRVALNVQGAETEVDRSVLEAMRSPLTHLVRNCVDHGIETAEQRERAGKPPEGTITISASRHGGSLVVEVADDGNGIDTERVRAGAIAKGIVSEDVATAMSERDALELIFRSGLSTARMITDLSGRGVGLDVVRENVERIHGSVEVESAAGMGTRFVLTLPLSVSVTRCLLARTQGQTFALPIASVARIVHVEPDQVHRAEGRPVIKLGDEVVSLVDLASVLGIPPASVESDVRRTAIVTGSTERHTALLVDELKSIQDMVTKSLPSPLLRVRHISGASILGTGEVVTVLSAAELVRTATETSTAAPTARSSAVARVPLVLVVDDSVTTRTLEKNILEASGFDVALAPDGLDAWTRLQAGGIDLVVSDIEMPRMDGFDLTARIRADERFATLPVILVSSLATREHRERGAAVGADAYIVKGAFEQDQLIETIRRLI